MAQPGGVPQYGSIAGGHTNIFCIFFSGFTFGLGHHQATGPMKGRTHHRGKQLECAGESLDIPLDYHPTILRIRMQLPLVSAGSEVIFLFIALLVFVRLDVLFNYNMRLYMTLTCCSFLLIFLVKRQPYTTVRLHMPGASLYP